MDAHLVLSTLTTLAERLQELASGFASPGVLLFHVSAIALATAPFQIARVKNAAGSAPTRARRQHRRNWLAVGVAFAGALFVLVVSPWGMLQALFVAGAFPLAWLVTELRSWLRSHLRPQLRPQARRPILPQRWVPQRSPRRVGSLLFSER